MKIKSLDELKKIREESIERVNLREHGETTEDKIEILIGMSTCGISAGARETLNAVVDEVSKEKLENVKVIPVGCLGNCNEEPLVQVNIPGEKPIYYRKIDEQKGREIVHKHIKDGETIDKYVIDIDIKRA